MKPLYQDLPFPIDSHIHYYIEDLPHFIVPWHYHPAIEIMYITRGIGTRFVGDCIEQYEEGDVCMIGPNLPHEWRNDDAYFDKESGLRATCICLFFKREIFDPNFIRLPEMNNIRDLIERSRRGLKFTGNSKLEITRFIRSSVNDVGVRKVTNLWFCFFSKFIVTDESIPVKNDGNTFNALSQPVADNAVFVQNLQRKMPFSDSQIPQPVNTGKSIIPPGIFLIAAVPFFCLKNSFFQQLQMASDRKRCLFSKPSPRQHILTPEFAQISLMNRSVHNRKAPYPGRNDNAQNLV